MPQENPAKTIENISFCPILVANNNEGHREKNPYEDGMPNQRQAPEAGYNKVACEFYIPEQGKCRLRSFFPSYAKIDFVACLFAEA